MSQPHRDWTDARAKVEEEGRCRRCHGGRDLEAAHIIGRQHDKDAGYIVVPIRVAPLCRSCHRKYDDHELDLMPHLTLEEQARAVLDAGGIELARQRTCPLAYKETYSPAPTLEYPAGHFD
jgi:hypothetical protein